jgi:hypothetical protein
MFFTLFSLLPIVGRSKQRKGIGKRHWGVRPCALPKGLCEHFLKAGALKELLPQTLTKRYTLHIGAICSSCLLGVRLTDSCHWQEPLCHLFLQRLESTFSIWEQRVITSCGLLRSSTSLFMIRRKANSVSAEQNPS